MVGAQWIGGAKVTPLSRSAKRPNTMSRLGLRLPQSLLTVSAPTLGSTLPSSRSRTSKYLPEIYIPVVVPVLLSSRRREGDGTADLLFRNNRGSLHRAHRIGIGKPQICFGYCGAVDAFLFSTFGRWAPLLKRSNASIHQVNEILGRDSSVLINILVLG